jgi:hypothetical protein
MLRAVIKARILWRTNSFCTLTTYSRHHACLVSNIQSRTQEEIRFSALALLNVSNIQLGWYHCFISPPSSENGLDTTFPILNPPLSILDLHFLQLDVPFYGEQIPFVLLQLIQDIMPA